MKTLLIIIVALCTSLVAHAQYGVAGGAVTSGAVASPVSGSFGLRATIGQPFLGNAGPSPNLAGGVQHIGDYIQQSYENTAIVLADKIQQVGDTFDFQLNYGAPCAFFQDGVEREWELKLTFNRTVLEPLTFNSVEDNGLYHTITVRGIAKAESGPLATLKFLALLGNDSVSAVTVESFRWTSIRRQVTRSTPGSVTLKGLCTTYGNTRLIKAPGKTSILVAPNPVSGASVGIRPYAESQVVGTLVVTDIHGNVIVTRAGVEAGPMWPLVNVELPVIPSGAYTVSFITADDIARTTLLKLP
ncbi:MAG: hypothetical protein ACK5BQ_00125 [Ignavibacteria bacterium]|jgi:hypothetical protein